MRTIKEKRKTRASRLTDAPYFRIRISGDLMKPAYPPGMTIEFRKLSRNERIIHGREYYVETKAGKAKFRRIVSSDRRHIAMVSTNRKHACDLDVMSRSNVACIALAVGQIIPILDIDLQERKSGTSVKPPHPQPESKRMQKAVGPMAA